MITYSSRTALAQGHLKSFYNDIEIYVEDTSCQVMWKRIIEKVISPKTKFSSVIALGSRDQVINACKKDQEDDGRRKLYIIDGDFDYIIGKRKPKIRNLYRLKSYCVENLLVSEESLFQVCMDSDASVNESSFRSKLNFPGFIDRYSDILTTMYLCYGTSQYLGSGIQSVSFPILNLCKSGENAELCPEKLRARIRGFVRDVCKVTGLKSFSKARKKFLQNIPKLKINEIVSGKSVILPIFWIKVKKIFKYRGDFHQFRNHLAREYSVSSEPFLYRRLKNL